VRSKNGFATRVLLVNGKTVSSFSKFVFECFGRGSIGWLSKVDILRDRLLLGVITCRGQGDEKKERVRRVALRVDEDRCCWVYEVSLMYYGCGYDIEVVICKILDLRSDR
jgi:hypothetical protein